MHWILYKDYLTWRSLLLLPRALFGFILISYGLITTDHYKLD